MKKAAVYPPLALLKHINQTTWQMVDMLHNSKGTNGFPNWPDWCYIPIGATLAVAMLDAPDTFENRMESIKSAQNIAALAPWRRSKEVYVMDADMQALLFEQANDLKLNPETLLRLPYLCFYIQFAPDTTKFHGVFVHLEFDTESKERELRLLYLSQGGETLGVPIHIDAKTIEESIDILGSEAFKNAPEEMKDAVVLETWQRKQMATFFKQTMQLVLYLCAQNAEVTPNPEQQTITRQAATIKDRYAEIRKWDVGIRIGSAVRAYRKAATAAPQSDSGESSHASPRPHMRRGHWHNFWHGSKSEPEERKLILQWVAPTFVNANVEDTPITLHHVRKED